MPPVETSPVHEPLSQRLARDIKETPHAGWVMAEDGALIWFAYHMALTTLGIFVCIAATIVEVLQKFFPGS